MAEAKSREQLETEWWDAWWAADYSWAGLAKHRIGGTGGLHGEKTLQDYWRRDPATGAVRDDAAMAAAGELVEIDGTTFHIVHLPAKLKAGAATWKAQSDGELWGLLDRLISLRLGVTVATEVMPLVRDEIILGRDGRCQLVGGVLRGQVIYLGPDQKDIDINGAHIAVLGNADYSDVTLGTATTFRGALFQGRALFSRASFASEANFSSAVFSGVVLFDSAKFYSGASFSRCRFDVLANFESALFAGLADFSGADFAGYARFEKCQFRSSVQFSQVKFLADASFVSATFVGPAIYRDIESSSAGVVLFGQIAPRTSTLRGATFESAVDFSGWRSAGRVYFDGVEFKNDMDFNNAVFDKLASFERILWPDDARHWHSAFDQALFRGTLALSGAGFMSYAAFDGATLERGIQIDDASEAASKQQFQMEKAAAIAAARAEGADFEAAEKEKRKDKNEPVTRSEVARHVRMRREERLKQLERGCRVLKQAMERASNKTREQLLYRFELQARRAQRGLPPGEALFSDLYGATSDYGASMVRPFVTLALLIAAFTALFFSAGTALGLVGEGEAQVGGATAWLQAFDLSWANVFKPLSALTAEGTPAGSLGDQLLSHSPLVGSLLRVAATLQSLLAIILAFLFALAVRRRFQIS